MLPHLDEAFIEPIAREVENESVTGLATVLTQLYLTGAFGHRDLFLPPREDRYTRRLIWADPQERFVIVGLTWSTGQSSPLHDHDGLWGAEIVVAGTMHETSFALVDRDDELGYRFVRENDRRIEAGGVGVVSPPLEYHDFSNVGNTIARTVHVYSGNPRTSKMYTESPNGWWTGRKVSLGYDE